VPVFERCYEQVGQIYPDAIDRLKFNEALKRMLNCLVSDLIENTRTRTHQAGMRTLEDVRQYPERLAAFSKDVEADRRAAKRFLHENLYLSPTLEPEKDDAERIVSELFSFWMQKPGALPPSYQQKAEEEPLPRVVCDYIAGMTDNFICEQYEKYGRG
jgi:dGTPase